VVRIDGLEAICDRGKASKVGVSMRADSPVEVRRGLQFSDREVYVGYGRIFDTETE
jgi:hypothetical protein